MIATGAEVKTDLRMRPHENAHQLSFVQTGKLQHRNDQRGVPRLQGLLNGSLQEERRDVIVCDDFSLLRQHVHISHHVVLRDSLPDFLLQLLPPLLFVTAIRKEHFPRVLLPLQFMAQQRVHHTGLLVTALELTHWVIRRVMNGPQPKDVADGKIGMVGKEQTRDFGIIKHGTGVQQGAAFVVGFIDLIVNRKKRDDESRVHIERFLEMM